MSDFRNEEGLVANDDQIFVLPKQYRPEQTQIHVTHLPGVGVPLTVCKVTPNGEVFKFRGATLTDVALILIEHYGVNFTLMQEIFDGPDAR